MWLLNPAFLYASTWLFVTVMYAMGLSGLLEPLQPETWLLIVGSAVTFILGWLVESISRGGKFASTRRDFDALIPKLHTAGVRRRLQLVTVVFLVGLGGEIIYFGGAPILSAMGVGREMAYTDFGLPGLHGLLNSTFYAACLLAFARMITSASKARDKFWLAVVSISYPVFGLSRQVLISLLLQYVILYFTVRRISAFTFAMIAMAFVSAFLIFGYLGDLRSGRDSIIALADPTFDYPEWLPSAFIWFYIYLCTPLNNVNYNIGIGPHYFPVETVATLIPSFARDSYLDVAGAGGGAGQTWELVNDSFNVSSLLQSLVTDFGVGGSMMFTGLCGIAFSRLLRNSAKRPAALFAIVVFLHGIALSFFANLLFHLVFLFEIVTLAWIVKGRKGPT